MPGGRPERLLHDRGYVLYLADSAASVVLSVGGPTLRKVAEIFPAIASVRFPVYGLGMAVVPVLTLGGYGLDPLLRRVQWPSLGLKFDWDDGSRTLLAVRLRILILNPLAINVRVAYNLRPHLLFAQPHVGRCDREA